MMTVEIEAYMLAWHQQQGCEVRIKQKGKNDWDVLKTSATELSAIAAILRENPVFLSNGWIHTGPEPTGD
jgi:hypothetical protein